MLYYLFGYLKEEFHLPGAGVFQYISFRAALALITSLIISLLFGKRIIAYLLKKQVGETIRDLGLSGQNEKQGTPTMGGVGIIVPVLIITLIVCNFSIESLVLCFTVFCFFSVQSFYNMVDCLLYLFRSGNGCFT